MELAENKFFTLVNSERSDEMCMQSHLSFQCLEAKYQLWMDIEYKHAVFQCSTSSEVQTHTLSISLKVPATKFFLVEGHPTRDRLYEFILKSDK